MYVWLLWFTNDEGHMQWCDATISGGEVACITTAMLVSPLAMPYIAGIRGKASASSCSLLTGDG